MERAGLACQARKDEGATPRDLFREALS